MVILFKIIILSHMKVKRYILLTAWLSGSILELFPSNPYDSIASQAIDSILFSELEEVTITATRSATILSADKTIYRPSAMISGSQGNIYEAIRSLPGVTIDARGDIRINGVQGLTVNIDGRKTILDGENLINYLKTVSVSDIEKIEIVNYAGAKADGTDAPAILNLVKHQRKKDRYSFGINIDGQLWKARQLYGAVFADYSKNGHGVSMNYSHYAARNPSELLTDRPYIDFEERLTQVYDRRRRDSSHSLSLAYDYRPSSRCAIGTTINYNYFKRKEPAVMTTAFPFEPNLNVTSNRALFVTHNIFGDLYVKRQLSDSKSGWTAACDFFRYESSEGQLMEDNTGMSVEGNMGGNTYGAVCTFDINKWVSRHWQLLGGVRISYVDMNSEGSYVGYPSNYSGENSIGADNLDSSFGYNENVNAVYAEGRGEYGIMGVSLGVRAEQSNLNSYFSGNESAESRDISRRYFHLYPSLSLMLSKSGCGSWMLAYANKVTRPRFSDLDPFIHLFDDITHVGGNINLKESDRHSLSLIWSDNSHWRVMTSWDYAADDIVKYYRELTDRVVYVTPENIPSHLQLLFSVAGSSIGITPWWTTSLTGNIIYSSYRFAEDTGLSKNTLWTPMVDIKNVLNLPYQVSAEVNASFRGRMAFGQAQTSHVWNTYIGFRKNFCEGKLSLSIYMKDIFNSNHFNSTILLSGRKAVLYEKEYEDMRKIGVSLSWSISGGAGISKKEERNIWIDELNRVNL